MKNKTTRRVVPTILSLAGLAVASPLTLAAAFNGSLAQDSAIRLFKFTADGTTPVVIQTNSYKTGGFDPLLSLFDVWGNMVMSVSPNGYLNDDGDGGGCVAIPADPATGLCLDAAYRDPANNPLAAGTYWLVLTESNNFSKTYNIADGFIWDGRGNVTGKSVSQGGVGFGCSNGSFCDYAGHNRSSAWSVDISGVASASEESAFSAPTNHAPGFVDKDTGNTVTTAAAIAVPKHTTGFSLKDLLHVSDSDIGQTLVYSVNEAPLHGTIKISSDATLKSGGANLAPGGTISYVPYANFKAGSDGFKLQVSDGVTTAVREFTATVSNDAPTLTTLGNVTGAVEDAAFTISHAALLAASNAADANEDPISFRVTALSSGTLTKNGVVVTVGTTLLGPGESLAWTPPPDANGTLTAFSVKAFDGALDSTTDALAVKAVVSGVNDPPSFTKGPDVTVAVSARSLFPGWATKLTKGPTDEAGQTLDFFVFSDNPSLFAVQPAIDGNTGNLSFSPAAGLRGTTTVRVRLHDNGGTASGGIDTSPDQTFLITIGFPGSPTANAGPSQTVKEGDTVTLDGSASSDPDAGQTDTLKFKWTPPDGIALSDASAKKPTFKAPQRDGSLSFTLEVTDADGNTASSQVIITVENAKPTADAGTNQTVNENGSVTLDGSKSSDPEKTPLTYQWTQASGPSVVLSDSKSAKPQFTAPKVSADTDLTFTLVVKDSDPGKPKTSDAATVRVTVRKGTPGIPVANAGSDFSANAGELVSLDGSASSDPDAGQTDTLKFKWTAPTGIALSDAAAKKPSFSAPQSDVRLSFQLVVTDTDGNASPAATVNVTIKRKNNPPEAHAAILGGDTVRAGSVKTLDGSPSFDPDKDVITYAWSQTGGPSVSLSSATAQKPTFTAPLTAARETLVFSLKVKDSVGAESTASTVSVRVTDDNNPPTVKIINNPVKEGAQVTLNATTGDPDGDAIASYLWQQTGGTPVVLSKVDGPSLSFTAPMVGVSSGQMSFSLTVTDNYSPNPKSATDAASVRVDYDPNLLDCSGAFASRTSLWPADKTLVPVHIVGITGPNDYNLEITGVTSDEPVKDKAAKDITGPDAKIKRGKATRRDPQTVDSVLLRAERQLKQKNGAGSGNGRVYGVNFTAYDGAQDCTGTVRIEVPRTRSAKAVDDGQKHDALAKQ